MDALATYFLKVNIVLSGLYFFYYMVCRPNKLLLYNRIFLLAAILFCIVLPLITIKDDIWIPKRIPTFLKIHKTDTPIQAAVIGKMPETNSFSNSFIAQLPPHHMSILSVFKYLYALVMLGLAVKLVKQLARVIRMIQKSSKYKNNGIIYCHVQEQVPSCSFFNYILMNKAPFSSEGYELIIKHEEAHCKQWHSIDLLLAECLHVFLWINPLLPGFKRLLKLNLEYLADEAVMAYGISPKKYQYQILTKVTNKISLSLVNALHSSKIKQRIVMMNRKPSYKLHLAKYVLAIPFIFCLCIALQLIKGPQTEKSNLYNELAGYYQFADAKHVLIHIMNQDGKLVLKQLWNNEIVHFEQKKGLNFYNTRKQFPIRFLKSADGKIVQVLAFEKDIWNKVHDYKSAIKKEIRVNRATLIALEGYYQYKQEPKYLKITAGQNNIVLKELWTGNAIVLFPETSSLFFSKQGSFPLEFVHNEKGAVIKAIAFHKDIWHKMKYGADPELNRGSM